VNLAVPVTKQETPDSCGVAALLAVLRYWLGPDAPVEEGDLYDGLEFDPKVGAEPRKMAATAKAFGLTVGVVTGASVPQVATAVAGGSTVILQLQAWSKNDDVDYDEEWSSGHYVVAVGVRKKGLVVMDPAVDDSYLSLSFVDLKDRWHGYDGKKRASGIAIFVSSKGDPQGEEPGWSVGGPLP
jgi:ABC-type bacteriocin/lantibiotic exporter with double-glycine peptidase domain